MIARRSCAYNPPDVPSNFGRFWLKFDRKFALRCLGHCSAHFCIQIIFGSAFRCAGEIHELKEELRTLDRKLRKGAVKKVIAAMTVGKDVSMLFPDVVNCMQTEDLELKKLVYLYLINYAKTQPDLAIMGVNTFVKVRTFSGA